MERRRALITAGAFTAAVLAAGSAYAVTSGVLGPHDDGAGNLTPIVAELPLPTYPSAGLDDAHEGDHEDGDHDDEHEGRDDDD